MTIPPESPSYSSLDLGVIGNCAFNALVNRTGRIVWCCLPRPDGDPVFHALVDDNGMAPAERGGYFSVELEDLAAANQHYVENTAVLRTILRDRQGNAFRITDFAPRFHDRGRMFHPLMLIRRIEPLSGLPRIRIRLRPTFEYGAVAPAVSRGSNHARYVHSSQSLRVTSDMPITYLLNETVFTLDRPLNLLFGTDETLGGGILETARDFEERTTDYWRHWVRPLGVPLEWQEAVIRAAITLKLCTFEETGAIMAAMTTSIPEASGTERTWDYRYCWLRDGFFVVRALNSLSEMTTMENYLGYLLNIGRHAERTHHLQPVYGIGLEERLTERTVESLAGYRGHKPVRVGNQACDHYQHDVYGNVVLAATQAFFDHRLFRRATAADFDRLEWVGERAFALHDQTDAGIWELRTRAHVHTSSSLMCWAACDRLSRIAGFLDREERRMHWRSRANHIRRRILTESWSDKRQSFAAHFGGEDLDASVLLMGEVGIVKPDDPRWRRTVETIGRELSHGRHLYRYKTPDDFGTPRTAFLACTFWHIDALTRVGRREEAREAFEHLLSCRNSLGLLSEDLDPATGELWGNYPQTYSMAGIINCAMRLSRPWSSVL